jgi:CRP-like cAMP-binding protein
MAGLERIVLQHPFFRGLEAELGATIAGCARNLRFEADAYLIREGESADELFLIREGRVRLEIAAPGQPPKVFSTLGPGEIVGVTWLAPPYRWTFDAQAMERVRAIGLDARCLRTKCEADNHLGYELLKRVASVLVARLHATRLQMLDVYGKPGS